MLNSTNDQILRTIQSAIEDATEYKESTYLLSCLQDPCGSWEIEVDFYGDGYNIHYSHEGVMAYLGTYKTQEEVVAVFIDILNGNVTCDNCCW